MKKLFILAYLFVFSIVLLGCATVPATTGVPDCDHEHTISQLEQQITDLEYAKAKLVDPTPLQQKIERLRNKIKDLKSHECDEGITVTQLATPVVTIEDYTATWGEQTNATGFIVRIGENSFFVTLPSFELSQFIGSFTITVQAIGGTQIENAVFTNSNTSEQKSFTIPNAALNQVNQMIDKLYQKDTIISLSVAIAEIQRLNVTGINTKELDKQIDRLNSYITARNTARDDLLFLIAISSLRVESDYTESTWDEFEIALSDAQVTHKNYKTLMSTDLQQAKNNLCTAKNSLEHIEIIDNTAMYAFIEMMNSIGQSNTGQIFAAREAFFKLPVEMRINASGDFLDAIQKLEVLSGELQIALGGTWYHDQGHMFFDSTKGFESMNAQQLQNLIDEFNALEPNVQLFSGLLQRMTQIEWSISLRG